MARKYETRCWLCSSKNLEPDERGIVCKDCGATFNVIPKPASSPVTEHEDRGASSSKGSKIVTYSPSGTAMRKAAIARQKNIARP